MNPLISFKVDSVLNFLWHLNQEPKPTYFPESVQVQNLGILADIFINPIKDKMQRLMINIT